MVIWFKIARGGLTMPDSPIRRAALLLHEAYGARATEEALKRAIAYRAERDEIGFDVWRSVAVAIDHAGGVRKTVRP